ncbi:MAG: adenosylcobinamide-phosphate synthase CbiB [Lachnospiraceae bacterium]|nr:adenosylcobinamide-phosphate synthase CbiB [Lachnospiraceae bacterium]
MIYHITAFAAGFVLDLFLGDPHNLPHPVKWMGSFIDRLVGKLLKTEDPPKKKRRKGLALVILISVTTVFFVGLLLAAAYGMHPVLGVVMESLMTYQCLATKSLYKESMKVYDALQKEGVVAGRSAVSMIVGRDTEKLDECGVVKAAVETVAENTSDGIIAPMLYLAVGGPVLGMLYKAVNTMDSMIGYQNDRYLDFGRYAAKLDDIANYLPARISAVCMLISCLILGKNYDPKNAWRIFKRDRYNHKSPNSAQTESVCAGALGIRLAGPASYFGSMVEKPYIGDDLREVNQEDIKGANVLMLVTAVLCECLCLMILISLL